MSYSIKLFLKLLGNAILFWSIALCLFIIIRYYALGDEEGIDNSAIAIQYWLKMGLIFGSIVGAFYAIIEFLFDKYTTKRLPL